jgi:hypothetical protein
MSHLIPLPNPACGADRPDGQPCPLAATAVVTTQSRPGRATTAWRCHGHASAHAAKAVQASPDATVTVRPLTSLDHPIEAMPVAAMPIDSLVTGRTP